MKTHTTYLVTLIDGIHDGFGWSANGSHVIRKNISMPNNATDRQMWMQARAVMGYTNVRGRYLDDATWMTYNSHMMLCIEHEEQ
tara:strand:+ start:1198 stop:1449 length:252 start_codon:yes stop_codon:yes gene_type:complete